MQIGARTIGPAHPPYVIAEIGVNHDGDPALAARLVDHAADAGADAVKFQLFDPALLLSRAARLAPYQQSAGERDPIEMLARLQLPLDAMASLIERAHAHALHAIVTLFSLEQVAPAAALPWDAFKTASPDIVNRPLLHALAADGRPLILSTGAAEVHEVAAGVDWLEDHHDRLALLHCVSCYPTPTECASLGAMVALRRLFHGPVGYSDHTMDTDTGALGVRLHAAILEKHLTHDASAPGPDHEASLEPHEFARYVTLARNAWTDRFHCAAPLTDFECDFRVGPLEKRVLPIEHDVRAVARQSVTTTRPLAPGDRLTRADLTLKRPGFGIAPTHLDSLVGLELARGVDADTPLAWNDLGLAGADAA